MNPEIDFEYGKKYIVTHRMTDLRCGKDHKIVKAKREFLMKEKRFGKDGIQCFVFTSRITKRMIFNQSIISIPHYDLINAEKVDE